MLVITNFTITMFVLNVDQTSLKMYLVSASPLRNTSTDYERLKIQVIRLPSMPRMKEKMISNALHLQHHYSNDHNLLFLLLIHKQTHNHDSLHPSALPLNHLELVLQTRIPLEWDLIHNLKIQHQ